MLTATKPGAAGSRLKDRIVGLESKVVVMLVECWMRPELRYHKTAATTLVERVGLCREVAKLG